MLTRTHEEIIKSQSDALLRLVDNPDFQVFMETVVEQREVAILDMVSDEVVANERKMAAAAGEVRSTQALIDRWNAAKDQAQTLFAINSTPTEAA